MKSPKANVLCEIVFLSYVEGGREFVPPLQNAAPFSYRPHLVVGGKVSGEYLGVAVVDASGPAEAGEMILAEVRLVYHPEVDYNALVVGATFSICEGGRIVGHGKVVG